MTALPQEAYAVIEGRHSDPFHYLGPHVEDDVPVVRVFLPDAEEVAVVDERGRQSDLLRIHDAGLFVGPLSNGSPRYQLRARFGESIVEMEDPYRFPPVLSELDLYLLAEGTHLHLYEKLGAHPLVHRRRRRRRLCGLCAQCPAGQRGRRFQFLGRPASRHARAREWILGNLHPGSQPGDKYKYEIVGRDGRMLPLKSDPVAFGAELRPEHSLDCRRSGGGAASAAGSGRRQFTASADLDL